MHYTSPIITSLGSDELRKMVMDRKIPDHEDYKNQHRIESLVMFDHPQLDDLERKAASMSALASNCMSSTPVVIRSNPTPIPFQNQPLASVSRY